MEQFEQILAFLLSKEVIRPLFIILGSVLVYMIVSRVIRRMFRINFIHMNVRKNKTMCTLTVNVFKYFVILVCALMLLDEFGVDTKTLVASLGVVGVVAGLAMQDTLKDFVSGIFILTDDQYKVGDTVTIDGFMGEVITLGMKTTKIRAYTGEVKMISNRTITSVINHSLDYSLALVDFKVAYEYDIDNVTEIVSEVCSQLSTTLEKLKGEVELWGVTSLDNGVEYRIAAKTVPMEHYAIERKIRAVVKTELENKGIELQYPHRVVTNE